MDENDISWHCNEIGDGCSYTWNGDELNEFSPFNLNHNHHNHRNIMGTNHRNVIMKNKIGTTYIYTDSTPNQAKSTPNQVKFFFSSQEI